MPKHQKAVPSHLPTVPETSEIPQILQATFAAYHAATQQGYNLSSLLATWNGGERSSNHGLFEQADRKIHNAGLRPNASEPALLSEHLEMAAHNSTDVNSNLPVSGGEDFCADGITMDAQSSLRQPPVVMEHHVPASDVALPPRVNPVAADTRVTDPSAAYLRRQLIQNGEEEAVCVDTELSHPPPPPPPALNIPTSTDQQIAPPASPTIPGKPINGAHLLGPHRDYVGVDGLAISPRTMESFRSLSGTTVASVQLSPDTEISGTAIPRIPESSDGLIQGVQSNLQT